MRSSYDIVIVGGGVIGCSIARALSGFTLEIALFEKGPDIASGTSRANSGVVHAGYANPPGSMKAELCVQGNRAFDTFTRELGVPFIRTGKLIVALSDDDQEGLERLMHQGDINGVPGLSLISGKEAGSLEPNIRAEHAILSSSSGITNPFQLTAALAENAARNGVEFFLNSEVTDIRSSRDGFIITSHRGRTSCRILINCAGLYSDRIAGLAGDDTYTIFPCRGEYFVLDKSYSHLISRMIYPIPPKEKGVLGVHLTPTIEGNILLGPTAEFIEEKNDTATTRSKMDILLNEARDLLPEIPANAVIQSFSGIRSKTVDEKGGGLGDFVISESKKVPGLINLIGIESPGLTCSAVIPEYVISILRELITLEPDETFDPIRRPRESFSDMSNTTRSKLILENPDHGHMICRCEHVTRQEVIESLDNPIGANTIDAIRLRTRATKGRCQGGFCLPKIVEILKERGENETGITWKGQRSHLFSGRVRDE